MKTIINTKTAGQISINSKYKGNKLWNTENRQQNYNNHIVTIMHNHKRFSFDFWGSIASPCISNDEENIFAFYCALNDGLGAKDSFENFCSEFGYDTDSRNDSRKAEKIYKACQKQLSKLERVFDCDLYDLINEIQETYNC